MAKRICKKSNQEIDFPKDCQGCASLNTSSETLYCTYKKTEGEKTSKKRCCH
ncbi:hypothetical protein KKH07_00670 [Patescibacteria group bacterium]|nr:hypothetical protein [Patescibacteria group bacterium]MBU1563604.1 hypothetical protein [Patescibacteria group bacterium]MBU2068158.1 hypothetical protein [Patescibacteria group bacterium]